MNVHLLWVIAIAMFLSACGEQQAPQAASDPEVAAPTDEANVAAEPAAPDEPAEAEYVISEEFVDEMHANADNLDELMFALADDDLDGARTAAHLLTRQKTVSVVQEEWQPYLTGMREAAAAVENAEDIAAAREAAERITSHCQDCHAAAGVLVE